MSSALWSLGCSWSTVSKHSLCDWDVFFFFKYNFAFLNWCYRHIQTSILLNDNLHVELCFFFLHKSQSFAHSWMLEKCDSFQSSFIREEGQLDAMTCAETHLPRLMTPRGIPVGVLKAGSSFSPSSTTLFLNNWRENTKYNLVNINWQKYSMHTVMQVHLCTSLLLPQGLKW